MRGEHARSASCEAAASTLTERTRSISESTSWRRYPVEHMDAGASFLYRDPGTELRLTNKDAAWSAASPTRFQRVPMEKLTLNPESLRVQSFAASVEAREDRVLNLPDATRPHICDPVTAWC
jgi:hypothetical protein